MNPITLFLAQLFAPVYLLLGLRFLFQPQAARELLVDLRHVGSLYLWGSLLVLGGTAVILHHNLWAWEPALLVTIIGWAVATKGAALLLFPRQMLALSQFLLDSIWLRVVGVVALILGGVLGWLGYFYV